MQIIEHKSWKALEHNTISKNHLLNKIHFYRTIPADWASDIHPEAAVAIAEVTRQFNFLFIGQLVFQERSRQILLSI